MGKRYLDFCPLTQLEVRRGRAKISNCDISYDVYYNGKLEPIILCGALFEALTNESIYGSDDEKHYHVCEHITKDIKKSLPLVFGELGKRDFQGLFGKEIHWDCGYDKDDDPDDFLLIKPYHELIKAKCKYPQTREEKADFILLKIKEEQYQDGEQIKFLGEFKYWGKLYLLNNDELRFYLVELEKRGFIDIEDDYVNLTLDGLKYVDGLNNKLQSDRYEPNINNDYEIALSFAGEQRKYVEQVANFLSEKQIKVFYDKYEEVSLWGKDLYQHLSDVYKNKCKYCIIFISNDYAKKLWTKHELASAQTRAFKENREYILPVRFDDTEIPGLNETVGYIDANTRSPKEIAELAFKKLHSNFTNIY